MHPGVKPIEDKPAEEVKKPVKKFPVKLKQGYFPEDPDFPRHPSIPSSPLKVPAGEVISLPIPEARKLIELGLAERADQIPIE